jgi:hypothetical protein
MAALQQQLDTEYLTKNDINPLLEARSQPPSNLFREFSLRKQG